MRYLSIFFFVVPSAIEMAVLEELSRMPADVDTLVHPSGTGPLVESVESQPAESGGLG